MMIIILYMYFDNYHGVCINGSCVGIQVRAKHNIETKMHTPI